MRVSLGYPDQESERRLLTAGDRREALAAAPAVLDAAALLAAQRAARAIYVSATLLDYVQALVAQSRTLWRLGLSPRAAQGLVRAAQGYALLAGERAVLPEHVQAVLPAVAGHRLERRGSSEAADGERLASELLRSVPVPI
jgi:MoxR-like ATPase